jgi:hypothetical protein
VLVVGPEHLGAYFLARPFGMDATTQFPLKGKAICICCADATYFCSFRMCESVRTMWGRNFCLLALGGRRARLGQTGFDHALNLATMMGFIAFGLVNFVHRTWRRLQWIS